MAAIAMARGMEGNRDHGKGAYPNYSGSCHLVGEGACLFPGLEIASLDHQIY